jgi:hypothetical protein
VSRLNRLSARRYGRLTDEQKRAVDLLEWQNPGAAERGEAKTTLRWRRTREETIAYAHLLLESGLMRAAVADRLRVSDDYLRRLLDPPKTAPQSRSPNRESRTNRQRQGVRSLDSPSAQIERPDGAA